MLNFDHSEVDLNVLPNLPHRKSIQRPGFRYGRSSGFSLVCTVLGALSCSILMPFGCGRSNETATDATPPTGKSSTSPTTSPISGSIKVALITPGPVSDNGWNAGAYQGLQDVKKDDGADIANVEAKSSGAQIENIKSFAGKGYNVVIGNGGEFQDPVIGAASEFPKTVFLISGGSKISKSPVPSNVQPIILQLEDGAYLEGMLAAGMSKTGKIGSVGATPDANIKSVFNAYELGAKAVKPDIKVTPTIFTNEWEDVSKAKQATNALLDQGNDVILQDLDAAAQGVFQAVQERAKQGKPVFALGTNSDQNAVAPDVILASAPIVLSKAFVPLVKSVKDGNFHPSTTPYDMKSGVIGFVFNPKFLDKIPADLKKKIEDTQKKILSGEFVVPKATS